MKTPYFLIKKKELDQNIDDFFEALHVEWGASVLAYSFKTNSLPWLLTYLKDKGCYAEVVSSCEYELALKLGYQKDKIVFNGPVKGKEEFLDAFWNGSIINIDSEREITWLEELEPLEETRGIGIRVNFGIEDVCAGEIGYEEDGTRFGFNYENGSLEKAINRLQNIPNIKVCGLHMHSTSASRSLKVYRALARMASRIVKEMHLEVEYIDIGGGFFGGMPGKTTFKEYVAAIRQELHDIDSENVTLIVEPGSAIIGSCVEFVTTVVDAKDNAKSRIVTIDGSRCNVDPLMIKKRHFYRIEGNGEVLPKRQVVCGYTCMDKDRLMVLEFEQELKVGDRLVFEKVGSYTMALNPLFIQYYPAVYVDEEGYPCVRRAWNVDDYLR